MPHHHGKRYRAALEMPGFDRHRRYGLDEALQILQKFPAAKFDETVGLSVRLGIDPKKSDQMVRGSVSLPKGIGKTRTVVVFAEGEAAKDAQDAGADQVGGEDLAKKIGEGWTDFDVCIAHPAMMRHVGRLGKVLGPQGKMPSPKAGTVTDKIGQAVREFKAGKVEFRTDAGGNVHVVVGKRSFKAEELHANIAHFIEHLKAIRPSAVKGTYVRKVCVASSMSPGIVLDVVV
jgi:large subunit ribosomal protein L1